MIPAWPRSGSHLAADPTVYPGAGAAHTGERLEALRRDLVELRERHLHSVAGAVAELSAFARSDQAPLELREVQRRIDRGELTWERVALGGVGDLRALVGDGLTRLPEAAARAQDLMAGGAPLEQAARAARAALEGEPCP